MELTWKVYAIVLPLLFLAGFVDAIGGGGGLVSLPAYLLAGLPPHIAVGTNKFSSTFGTGTSLMRFVRGGYVRLKLAIPCVIGAAIGSFAGARLNLLVSERALSITLLIALPIMVFIVFNKKLFREYPDEELVVNRSTLVTGVLSALIVGAYDGFYGPGAGTLWIIAFTVFAKLGVKTANAHAKVINFATSLTSLLVYMHAGAVIFAVGAPAALANMAGGYLGSGLAIKNGSKITKPIIILMLILLMCKVISDLFLSGGSPL